MVAPSADGSGSPGGDRVFVVGQTALSEEDIAFQAGYLNRPLPDSAKHNIRLMRAYGEGQDAFEEEKEADFLAAKNAGPGADDDPCGCVR